MILIFLILAAVVIGCGSETSGDRVAVVATTEVAADVARQVAGPDASVEALLPGSASPHDYSATAQERARLEEADVVVAWGAGLEEGLPLDDLDPAPVELAAGETDPHVWMDPTRLARSLPALADALASSDAENADDYRRRADAFAERLDRLDRELRDALGAIPTERRKLVTSHDSLGHFARRYDFEFVGAPFGRAPEAEPSAAVVAELIRKVEDQEVPAVFAEDTDNPRLMRQIARQADVEVVDDLLVEGFGGQVESYEEMMRFDARRITEALGL